LESRAALASSTFTGYQPTARNVADFQSQGYAANVDQVHQWWKA